MCVFSPYSVLFEVDAEMEEPDLEAGTAKVPESCSPPF